MSALATGCLLVAVAAGAARAEGLSAVPAGSGTAMPLGSPLSLPQLGPRSTLLAQAASTAGPAESAADRAAGLAGTGASEPPLDKPWLTGRNAHKWLGLGTVALVGLTGLTAPHNSCESNCNATTNPRRTSGTPHTRLARAASTFAAATVTSGLLVHWDDFHLKDGFSDPDNQHIMLGLGGALLMMTAVNKSMHSQVPTQHAGTAALGGVAMAVAVKLTW